MQKLGKPSDVIKPVEAVEAEVRQTGAPKQSKAKQSEVLELNYKVLFNHCLASF